MWFTYNEASYTKCTTLCFTHDSSLDHLHNCLCFTYNIVTPSIQFCMFYVQYSYLYYYSLHFLHIFQCFTYSITVHNSSRFTCITVIYIAFRYTVYITSFCVQSYCTPYKILCVLHTVYIFTPSAQLVFTPCAQLHVLRSTVLYTFYTQLFVYVLRTTQLSAPLRNSLCFTCSTVLYTMYTTLCVLHTVLLHALSIYQYFISNILLYGVCTAL